MISFVPLSSLTDSAQFQAPEVFIVDRQLASRVERIRFKAKNKAKMKKKLTLTESMRAELQSAIPGWKYGIEIAPMDTRLSPETAATLDELSLRTEMLSEGSAESNFLASGQKAKGKRPKPCGLCTREFKRESFVHTSTKRAVAKVRRTISSLGITDPRMKSIAFRYETVPVCALCAQFVEHGSPSQCKKPREVKSLDKTGRAILDSLLILGSTRVRSHRRYELPKIHNYDYLGLSNVAEGKVTCASSVRDRIEFSHKFGNDGNRHAPQFFSTKNEDCPWWQIDLGALCDVTAFRIWYTSKERRLKADNESLWIIGSFNSFSHFASLPKALRLSSFKIKIDRQGSEKFHEISANDIAKTGLSFTNQASAPARFIRIQMVGKGELKFAEFEIFAQARSAKRDIADRPSLTATTPKGKSPKSAETRAREWQSKMHKSVLASERAKRKAQEEGKAKQITVFADVAKTHEAYHPYGSA